MYLVKNVSEPDKSDPWELRKQHTIESLKTDPSDVLYVSLADKLDNIRAIKEDFDKVGDAVWERFNRPYRQQKWYYEALADVFGSRIVDDRYLALARLLGETVKSVFQNRIHQVPYNQ